MLQETCFFLDNTCAALSLSNGVVRYIDSTGNVIYENCLWELLLSSFATVDTSDLVIAQELVTTQEIGVDKTQHALIVKETIYSSI